MVCTQCGGKLGVIDTRKIAGNSIQRYRTCQVCGAKSTTLEIQAHWRNGERKQRVRIPGLERLKDRTQYRLGLSS